MRVTAEAATLSFAGLEDEAKTPPTFSNFSKRNEKSRQRARSLRTFFDAQPTLPWLLGKVFWLRDGGQVCTLLPLNHGPAGCGVFARVGRRPT